MGEHRVPATSSGSSIAPLEAVSPGLDRRFALGHELYGRALGAVSLVAWLSLHVQLEELFGERGILPMGARLTALIARDGDGAFASAPSLLFLFGGSSASMHALAMAGELCAVLMTLGIAPGLTALLSYVLYLSFVSLGWPFVPLQWDTLLLEALIIAALIGRWRAPLPSRAVITEPSRLAVIAGGFLVVRLIFASGLVKLLSGDPTWRDGTAMGFHHWTQPLPSPIAPLLHAMPASAHTMETYLTLLLEIGAPVLVLFGPRGRKTFAAIVLALMIAIAVSGSYGFFHLLTIVLCIPLLDDAVLSSMLPRALRVIVEPRPTPTDRAAQAGTVVMGAYLLWAAIQLTTSLGLPVPAALETPYLAANRWHVASHYGLFAVMTTDRPELTFEVSVDGAAFSPLDFRYKPGDPARGPAWCAPHMPRFDWMLWFAALDEAGELPPWVRRVALGLLEGRPETWALFHEGARPTELRAVRVVRSRYRFGDGSSDEPWTIEDRRVLRTFNRRFGTDDPGAP